MNERDQNNRKEIDRLSSLRSLNLLDTDPEQGFDELVELASYIASTPIALISLVDENRQWFKASVGLAVSETDRSCSFCAHAIENIDSPMIVEDATVDPRFKMNPLVTAAPNIRFYAGFPILSPNDRLPIGTVCVISDEVRTISQEQVDALRKIANQVEQLLVLRLNLQQAHEQDVVARMSNYAMDNASDAVFWIREDGTFSYVNQQACNYLGYTNDELRQLKIGDINPSYPAAVWLGHWKATKENGMLQLESTHLRKDGSTYDCHITKRFLKFEDAEFIFATVRDITNQKIENRRLAELAASNKAFVDLLSFADGVWDWTVGSEAIFYSPGFRKILGFDGEDTDSFPNTRNALDLRLHPDDREPFWQEIEKCLSQRSDEDVEPLLVEFRIRDRDEQHIWMRCRATPSFGQNGKAARMVGFAYDISSQVHARESLFRQTAELEHLIDWMPLALIYADTSRQITRINRAFREMFGYDDREVMGQKTLMLYRDKEEFSRTGKERFNLTAEEKKLPYEAYYRRKDGTVFCGEAIGSSLRDFEGDRAAFVALLEDITDRKEAQRAVRENNDKIRGIFENAHSFLGLLTVEGTLAEVNPSATRSIGAKREDVIGTPFWDTPWWENSPETQALFKEAISLAAGGTFKQLEVAHSTRQGEIKTLDFSIFPVFSDGEVIFLFAEGRDITAERLAVLKLENLNDELKQSNRELEQFAYIASHDLRSPLRGVKNIVGFLREDEKDLSESSKDFLGELENRVIRMDELLNDLLIYSRVGNHGGVPQIVDSKVLVDEVLELLDPPAGIQLIVHESLPNLMTYDTPLRQVFLNLIGNAIKYHHKPVGKIEISSKIVGDWIEFSVRDDGPGIDCRYHEKIFAMFQRLENGNSIGGSGIGLPLIQKIVRRFGGKVVLESKLGQGSTFRFTWPQTVTTGKTG